jgi:hypothetical protein
MTAERKDLARGVSRGEPRFFRIWAWLFPASYLLHIAEEYLGGFPAFVSGFTGLPVSNAAFLAANAVLWLLMLTAVLWAGHTGRLPFVVVFLATIVTINAVSHAVGALLTQGYSPGMMSGAFLWLPLGLLSLLLGKPMLARSTFRSAVAVGVGIHLLVPLVGVGFAWLLP